MPTSRDALRKAFGLALRRLRQEGNFSLDDVQHATAAQGLAVTRSHLSRVETGTADLNLPRFLVLLRALGVSPGPATEGLDGLLDPEQRDARALAEAAWRARAAGDLHAACDAWRRLAPHLSARDTVTLSAWAAAEASLGRWRRADDVLQRIVVAGGDAAERLAVRRAVVLFAAGQLTWGSLLADASGEGPPGVCARALACLVAGHAGRTLELLAEPTRQNWPAPWRAIAVLLVGATYRWRGQRKLAMQTITPLLDHSVEPLVRTEALLLQAQLLSDTKPPRTALAAIDAARAAARQLAHPALLARCHDAAAAMLRLVGEEREARDAERAALALRRRCQADPAFDPHWPLLAVHAAAFDPPAVEVSQAVP